jgi:hypothetical protein
LRTAPTIPGMPLLLAATALLDAWPWALTPLTGRAIGAWAIGIGTIAAHAAWENNWWRLRPMMLRRDQAPVPTFDDHPA